jgi:hypothetical protein
LVSTDIALRAAAMHLHLHLQLRRVPIPAAWCAALPKGAWHETPQRDGDAAIVGFSPHLGVGPIRSALHALSDAVFAALDEVFALLPRAYTTRARRVGGVGVTRSAASRDPCASWVDVHVGSGHAGGLDAELSVSRRTSDLAVRRVVTIQWRACRAERCEGPRRYDWVPQLVFPPSAVGNDDDDDWPRETAERLQAAFAHAVASADALPALELRRAAARSRSRMLRLLSAAPWRPDAPSLRMGTLPADVLHSILDFAHGPRPWGAAPPVRAPPRYLLRRKRARVTG